MKELISALAKFQANCSAAPLDSKGNFGSYTSLASALNVAQEACKFGLCHSQTLRHEHGEHVLITSLLHVSGELLQSEMLLPSKIEGRSNHMQAMGSAFTYARRYAILAIYGLASDDDDASALKVALPAAKASHTAAPTLALCSYERKAAVCADLKASENKDQIIDQFKSEFKISAVKIGPAQIVTTEHADFLEAALQF